MGYIEWMEDAEDDVVRVIADAMIADAVVEAIVDAVLDTRPDADVDVSDVYVRLQEGEDPEDIARDIVRTPSPAINRKYDRRICKSVWTKKIKKNRREDFHG